MPLQHGGRKARLYVIQKRMILCARSQVHIAYFFSSHNQRMQSPRAGQMRIVVGTVSCDLKVQHAACAEVGFLHTLDLRELYVAAARLHLELTGLQVIGSTSRRLRRSIADIERVQLQGLVGQLALNADPSDGLIPDGSFVEIQCARTFERVENPIRVDCPA